MLSELANFPNSRLRTIEELEASALAVIELAFTTPTPYKTGVRERYPDTLAPLYSGGHDSQVVCHLASKSKRFTGDVYHIKTGIGSRLTLQHVRDTAKEHGWNLIEIQSKSTYEKFIRDRGFPGPAMHQRCYIRLKERCVRMISRGRRVALVTGCRSGESVRRMGHVEPLKLGEFYTVHRGKKKGQVIHHGKNRSWLAPCHDWSTEDQIRYMEHYDLPRNPVKIALGMSGECFCGAFAAPGEYERIRRHCPDVADEIDRLSVIARECGQHDKWGTRPEKSKGVQVAASGPLCSTCDLRAAAAGITFLDDSTWGDGCQPTGT